MNKNERRMQEKARVMKYMMITAMWNGKSPSFHEIENLADMLHRDEVRMQHLAERECDDPTYGDADQRAYDRAIDRVVTRIKDEIGAVAYVDGDPRGWMIRMRLLDENGKPWSNSGDGETAALAW